MCFTFQLVQSFQVLVMFFNQFNEFGLFAKPLVANGFNVGAEIFNVVRERDDELLFGSFVVQVLFQHFQFPTVLFHLYTFHSDLFFHSFDFLFNCVQVTNFLPNIVGHDFQFFVDFSSGIG
uniref:Uncharacterized protein n=1 Tax=Cacopsylla melanoneura TaxID=428564 RepID=A0A8D8X9C7_9HEMI